MAFRWNPREHLKLCGYVLKWLLIAVPVGAVVGASVAFFLWILDVATQVRWSTDMGSGIPWLLFLLPVAGVLVSAMYSFFGKSAEGGNNLVIDKIHDPGGVPCRMAPLVLAGTVITHLFGGSAGREGTAVQMGGSLASGVGRIFNLDQTDTRTILMAGVAAGFGAVFGTPLTGAVFAVEVLAVGLISFESIIPCLIASVAGDWTTSALGIHHTHYFIGNVGQTSILAGIPQLNLLLLGKVAAAAVAFGLASVLFAELAHSLQTFFKTIMPRPLFRPVIGAAVIIVLAYCVGPDYLGLGVVADPNYPGQVSILSSFREGGATTWSWWWKTLFTTVTLSSGFKGGEVTPLFFIGASLGNALAGLLHAPVGLFAGLGFVAVFAGATNTPLACTIMGIELFGGQPELMQSGFVVYLATACFIAYLISGHSGIYLSQRIGVPKCFSPMLPPDASLRTVRSLQPSVGVTRLIAFSNNHVGTKNILGKHLRRGNAVTGDLVVKNKNLEVSLGDDTASRIGEEEMSHRYKVSGKEIGQVRIYMTPSDKRTSHKIKKIFTRPLYQEIIDAAKEDGILNAVAHHTHYGYSGNGKIQSNKLEMPNDRLSLCIELISRREHLEKFCRKHGDLLQGKVIVYKHIEHWEIGLHKTIVAIDADPEELNEADDVPCASA